MKKRTMLKVVVFVALPILFVAMNLGSVVAVETAIDETQYYQFWTLKATSQVKTQTAFVFNEELADGVSYYMMYIDVLNQYGWNPTTTDIFIYIRCLFKRVLLQGDDIFEETLTWGPAPQNMVTFFDYDYICQTQSEWSYSFNVGGEYKCFSFGFGGQYTPIGQSDSVPYQSNVNGWKYIGRIVSWYANAHHFDVSIPLHIENEIASSYYGLHPQGTVIIGDEEYTESISIEQVQLRVDIKYYQKNIFGAPVGWRTHTHTLGDGNGLGDVNQIPFLAGDSGF